MREKLALLVIFTLFLAGPAFGQEDCSNGIDDNGNGLIDCNDPECQFSSTIEKGCNCYDGIDNDGDGNTDIYDPDCASYYGLTFVDTSGSDCSIQPPDSQEVFDFVDPVTTGQNTVDTQSKMAIGDVDCDGIPDVVATSKWNKSIRVIATSDGQADGSNKGDIKSEFRTPGSGIFPPGKGGTGNQFRIELEVMIADIDGDCTGEIFAIASRIKDSNDPPSEFFLIAFEYTAGNLTPMYDAVPIGTSHPGIPGIADFDGDGKAEIYLKNAIYAAETGALLAKGTGDWPSEVNAAPTAVDILGDSNLELISGNIIYSVPDLSNRNPGSPAALTVAKDLNDLGAGYFPKELYDPVEYSTTNFSSTSVADMNGDGNLDIVLSGANGSPNGNTAIFYWDVTNNTYSVFEPPDPNYAGGWPWGTGRPNLADLDGNGDMDINFIAGNQLWALTIDDSGNLVELWDSPRTINDSRSGIVATTVYDFNNDGQPELVYRDSQQLVVVDGATGKDVQWTTPCQSHTWTEGPIIADVNGDGSTDVVVPCNFSNAFDINDPIQQQALGEIRIYNSTENNWLPTRQVWNQSGYFVVNIKDDLTLPTTQFDQTTVFSENACSNGIPGPVRPFNTFLNQVPTLGADGCPFYPAPDVSFVGDNPNAQPGDPDYVDPSDPNYFPTVDVIPPVCGDLEIEVEFNIINNGALTISSTLPVSFWDGDPTIDPVPADPATLLHQEDIQLTDFKVGDTLSISGVTFNSTGEAFRLYIVLNDDGTSLPAGNNGSTIEECDIDNNVYYFDITPDPFEVDIEKISDNVKCEDSAPDNGELRAVVYKNGVEVTDYSNFAFQWYDGPDTTTVIPAPDGTSNVLTDLPEGDYTVVVTNTDKGCASLPTDTSVVRIGVDPEITIVENSPQTQCDPPNGELEVFITGGNDGYTFEWFDRFLNPIGITGAVASNLEAGEYIVSVFKDGCTKTASFTLSGPVFPVVTTSVLEHVVDCDNPNSGKLTAEASISGILQDSTDYTFTWYEWDSVASDVGSVLPPQHGSGPTRYGLLPGEYAVIARDENTGCESSPPARAIIENQTELPDIIVSELEPQTSCDPANPNGRLQADGYINGVFQDPATLTFEWFEGDNTLPENLITDVSGINGEIAEGIANTGLPYTVRVTTTNNCSATKLDTSLTENLEIPVINTTTFDNTICDSTLALGGAYNGRVETLSTLSGNTISDFSGYTFTWYKGSGVDSDSIIPNNSPDGDILYDLNAGRYTVVLERNATACVSDPVTVEIFDVTSQPTILVSEVPATNCIAGTPNGQLSASVDEGGTSVVGGYNYDWFEGVDVSGSGTLVANVSGTHDQVAEQLWGDSTYTVLVIDDTTGCSNTRSVVLTNDSQIPQISLTKTNNSICDTTLATVSGYNGFVYAVVDDRGNPVSDFSNYTIEWFDGTTTSDPVLTNTNADGDELQNVPGGFYTARVTNDSLGCISDPLSIEVKDTLVLPDITITPSAATNCDPALANGEATADVGGTTSGYVFKWVAGVDVNDPAWSPVTGSVGETALQLTGGDTYTVKVTNETTGCVNNESVIILDNSDIPVVSLVQTPNTICDPVVAGVNFDGTISTNTTYKGNPVADFTDYYFNLFEGSDTTGVILASSTNPDPVFDQLDSGFYTVRAYNTALGCYSDPAILEVQEDFVFPVIGITEQPATNCDPNLPNGQLTADAGGTTAGHLFKWAEGNDVDDPQWSPVSGSADETAEALTAGNTYTVKVTNSGTGCFSTEGRIVSDNSDVPVIGLNQSPNTICDPVVAGVNYNGEINGNLSYKGNPVGDYSDYYFRLFDGSDTTSLNTEITAVPPSFTQLDSGFYTVRAYNSALGCYSDPVTIEVQENFVFPDIGITEQPATNCDPSLPNGQLTADAGGGIAGHIFKWVAGNDVNAAQWSPVSGTADETAESLSAGDIYTVKVANTSTGCFSTEARVVSDSSRLPMMTLNQIPNNICDPAVAMVDYNGIIDGTLTYDGNNVFNYSNYFFRLFDGTDTTGAILNTITASSPVFTDLDSGFYTVRAYNAELGCYSDPVTIEVEEDFTFPNISLTETPATNCDPALPNGQVAADVGGTTVGHAFKWVAGTDTDGVQWSPVSGIADQIAEELTAGDTYTVKVTVSNTGCFETKGILISDLSEVPVLSLSQTPNTVCDPLIAGAYDGTITGTLNYQGAVVADFTPYDFKLFEGSDTTGVVNTTLDGVAPDFIELDDGDYTARAYDFNTGCFSDPVSIQVQDATVIPAIVITKEAYSSCDPTQPNGRMQAMVNEGGSNVTAGYTFTWHDGNTTADPVVVTLGGPGEIITLPGNQNYTVEVLNDATGCLNTRSEFLPENVPQLSIINVAVSDIVDCNTGGSLEAEVDSAGVAVADFTNYDFNWYRGSNVVPGQEYPESGNILSDSLGNNLFSDFYTVYVQNTYTHCYSDTVSAFLNPPPPLFDIGFEINNYPTDCNVNEGALTAWVDSAIDSFNYNFYWYEGRNINGGSNFYTNPGVEFDDGGQDDSLAINTPDGSITYSGDPQPVRNFNEGPTIYRLIDGAYSVVVEDRNTGCREYIEIDLPAITSPPTLIAFEQGSTICPYTVGNGIVDVQINEDSLAANGLNNDDYDFYLMTGVNSDTTTYIEKKTGEPNQMDSTRMRNDLAPGFYTVMAVEKVSGSRCPSVPYTLFIDSLAKKPLVQLNSAILDNTSCDTAVVNGEIELLIAKDPLDATPASTYDITWTQTSSTPPGDQLGVAAGVYNYTGLNLGQYNVTVTDLNSTCTRTRTFTLYNEPPEVEVDSSTLIITDKYACLPSGHIEITDIQVDGGSEPLTDFLYDWYDGAANLSSGTDIGGGPIAERLDSITYPAIHAGDYYVIVIKDPAAGGDGLGCSSAPLRRDILDKTIDPALTFTQTANQSCDPATLADGTLRIEVTPGTLSGGSFNYTWNNFPFANPGDRTPGTDDETWTALGPGSYEVDVEDTQSGCATIGIYTINDNPITPVVLDADIDIQPQEMCLNDGSVEVTAISPGALGDYTFTWYEGQTNLDGGVDLGVNSALLNNVNHPGIQAGEYFFAAQKTGGATAGYMCITTPYKAVIEDTSEDPVLALSQTANQSCDTSVVANGTITATVTPGALSANRFNYTWTAFPTDNPGNITGGTGTTNETFNDRSYGQYTLEIEDEDTRCTTTGTITVVNNPYIPTVLSTDIVIVDQDVCIPDGSITINDITPGNTGEYTFTWYEGLTNLNGGTDIGGANINVLNTGNHPTIQAGDYYFTAQKTDPTDPVGYGCETSPYKATIDDISVDPFLALTQTANQSCDTSVVANGTITVTVTPGSQSFDRFNYTWTAYPTDNPGDIAGGTGTINETFTDRSYGQYTLQVEDDDTKCVTTGNVTVAHNPYVPAVLAADIVVVDQDVCIPDGSITVTDISPGNTGEYTFAWYEGFTNLDVGIAIGGATTSVLNTGNHPAIQAGDYYFIAQKTDPADPVGYGCETSPYKATIEDVSADPSILLTQTANQSCDTAVVANGTITVTVTPGSQSANNFNYTWTAFPTDNPGNIAGGAGSTNETFTDRSYGTYSIEVEDEDTQCKTSGNITVANNPYIPVILDTDFTVNDQTVCFNDGSIIVSGINPGDTSEYDFTWYEGQNNLNNDNPIPGVVNGVLDPTVYASIQAGDYFFKAQKADPSDPVGYGCETSPIKAVIDDVSVDPFITLTPTANQNCDLSFANGTITALASTDGVPGPSYSYTLTSTMLGAPVDSLNNDAQVVFEELQPGSYNVLVIEDNSQCTFNRSVSIDDKPAKVDITDVLYMVYDKVICLPDGSIVVDDITENSVAQPLGNYQFAWYDGQTDLNNDNSIAGVIDPFLDSSNYATIGAGTYFFSVTKVSGTTAIGEGCESAPLRGDIKDLSTDPNVRFDLMVNTSCDTTNPNGLVIANAFENDGTDTDIYDFAWSYNGGALPGFVVQNDSSNSSTLANAPEGNYRLTVTNSSRTQCQVTSSTPLDIDLNASEPNIIVVDVIDPLNCFPTGELEVTQIKVGGQPANVNDFEYYWYQGSFTPGDLIMDSLGNPVDSSHLVNQTPDSYYVIARNFMTQCESDPKEAIISDAAIRYPAVYIDEIAPQTSCDPARPNAALEATVDGGNDDTNPNYQFEWFNSQDATGPLFATTSSIYGLPADVFSVRVHDFTTNCSAFDYYYTADGIEDNRPVISVASSPKLNCAIDDGSVSAQVINIGGNFDFNWYIGNSVGTSPDYTGSPVNGLPNGFYTVTATELDTTFCTSAPVVVEVKDGRKNPVVTIKEDNPLTYCWENDPNGQLSATVEGVVGGYTFDWYNSSDTTGNVDYTGHTYIGIPARTYTLVATNNSTLCKTLNTVDLSDSTITPPSPDPVVVQHLQSCLDPDGWVRASVGGNVTNYLFDWYDGPAVGTSPDQEGINYRDLIEGSYTVTAQDVITGCISEGATVEVLDLREYPEFDFEVEPARCERSDGIIEIVWLNTAPVERVIWINPVSRGQIDEGSALYNYPAGDYGAVVTTVFGCEAEGEVEIPTEIFEFNGISANGDGRNDYFEIACISMFPNNHVRIYNRAGQMVYEEFGYNNAEKSFKGVGENGLYLMGKELPDGTYFYIIDKGDGSEPIAGYLELIR